jgi:hypothetical protein
VSDAYADFIKKVWEDPAPFQYMSVQFFFLAYLLLGQGLLLAAWRLLRGAAGLVRPGAAPAAASWWGRAAFAVFLLAGQVALLLGWPPLVSALASADQTLLADVVVIAHLAFVLAVLLTLLLVLAGWPLGWRWTGNFWFRLAQLVAIEVVAGQAIVGLECPMTTWERELRPEGKTEDGDTIRLHNLEGASRLGALCHDGLFFLRGERFKGLFALIYGSVALLALLTWVLTPPRLPWDGAGVRGPAVSRA